MNKEEILSKVRLFGGLSANHVKGLAQVSKDRVFSKGEYLMRQGENGIGLFIITSGKVKILKKNRQGEVVEIAENAAGDVIGEMAVIDGAPRTASVQAAEDVSCIVLTSWDFNAFMKAHPDVALQILPVVVKRFRETNEALTGTGHGA